MKLQHRTLNYLSPILFLLLGTILLPAAAQAQLTPGRIPKVTSTFPRFRIADSLISEDGKGIHIGAMSIAPTGEITFCCGQGFGAGAWSLNGNAGTNCTASPCSNFLGTNDNTSMEIRVDGQRAYRIEPATSTVSGGPPAGEVPCGLPSEGPNAVAPVGFEEPSDVHELPLRTDLEGALTGESGPDAADRLQRGERRRTGERRHVLAPGGGDIDGPAILARR